MEERHEIKYWLDENITYMWAQLLKTSIETENILLCVITMMCVA